MYKKLSIFIFIFFIQYSEAQNEDLAVFIDAGDNQGLVSAIENANNGAGPGLIFIRPGPGGETTFTFTQSYMGTNNALPVITSNVELYPVSSLGMRIVFKRGIAAPQFRLFEVTNQGELGLGVFNVESFSISGNGGAILADGNSRVACRGVSFRNNFASGEGGAIFMGGDSMLFCKGTGRLSSLGPGEFKENRAGTVGGAISIQDNATANILHHVFINNTAGVFGCDLNVNSSSNANFGQTFILQNNTFTADCSNVLIENPLGRMLIRNNSFTGMGDVADSTDLVNLFGNLFAGAPSNNNKNSNLGGAKAICNDFGTNAFNSLGYNISNESSCNLNQSTDLPDTNPMVNVSNVDGVISLKTGSPAIDAGATAMQENPGDMDFLPCGYVDSRGLGRPQDANGDGVFECDMGSYEVQGGPDITAAQSGLYFDADRNGEGIRVEMLGGGAALVAMFTYDPNGNDLMWWTGRGEQRGNSIVVDEVYRTTGGAFGSAFEVDNIEIELVGSLSLVFPNCEAGAQPGRMMFESDKSVDDPLENLLVESSTISRLLSCNQNQFSNKTGRSGAFFDPKRSGEGLFIDVINDDTAVIFFYTFTPAGKQIWLLGSQATISGNTITADMAYPSSTTGFGSGFNPDDVVLSNWGTITISHQPGCNNIAVSYNAVIPGYGSGDLTYTRLTQPDGVTCDL